MSQPRGGRGNSTGPRTPTRPRPPGSFAAVEDEHNLADEATFSQLAFTGLDRSAQSGDSMEFSQCRFTRATLAGAVLERATFHDCIIESCDWANLRATKSSLARVEVTSTRLTGLHWIDGALRDVTFRECRMELTAFRFSVLKDVWFVDCNLTRADFTNADLRQARFTGCDLAGAQFAQVRAEGARFERCDLSGVGSVTQLAGAIVSGMDLGVLAVTLATAIGIVVEQS